MSRPFSTENVFRALAHPVRRQAVEFLAKRDQRPSELNGILRCSLASLSQHLRVLRHSGLVTTRREGRTLVYHLNRDLLAKSAAWVIRYGDPAALK